jgi:hypothetical protein
MAGPVATGWKARPSGAAEGQFLDVRANSGPETGSVGIPSTTGAAFDSEGSSERRPAGRAAGRLARGSPDADSPAGPAAPSSVVNDSKASTKTDSCGLGTSRTGTRPPRDWAGMPTPVAGPGPPHSGSTVHSKTSAPLGGAAASGGFSIRSRWTGPPAAGGMENAGRSAVSGAGTGAWGSVGNPGNRGNPRKSGVSGRSGMRVGPSGFGVPLETAGSVAGGRSGSREAAGGTGPREAASVAGNAAAGLGIRPATGSRPAPASRAEGIRCGCGNASVGTGARHTGLPAFGNGSGPGNSEPPATALKPDGRAVLSGGRDGDGGCGSSSSRPAEDCGRFGAVGCCWRTVAARASAETRSGEAFPGDGLSAEEPTGAAGDVVAAGTGGPSTPTVDRAMPSKRSVSDDGTRCTGSVSTGCGNAETGVFSGRITRGLAPGIGSCAAADRRPGARASLDAAGLRPAPGEASEASDADALSNPAG